MKKIFISIFLYSFFSCNYQHNELKIINNSSEVINYETYFHSNLVKNDIYNKFQKDYYLDFQIALNPKDSVRPVNRNSWQYNILNKSKNSTLTIAFFNRDTIKKYGWDLVINQKKYKTYTYTIDDLSKLKWTLIYTGNY